MVLIGCLEVSEGVQRCSEVFNGSFVGICRYLWVVYGSFIGVNRSFMGVNRLF